jgi:hypothetical protein
MPQKIFHFYIRLSFFTDHDTQRRVDVVVVMLTQFAKYPVINLSKILQMGFFQPRKTSECFRNG